MAAVTYRREIQDYHRALARFLAAVQDINRVGVAPEGGGDPTLAQNWRPIAITNLDYRLLARVLNARLAAVASRLVAEGQSNAVPGRRMGTSLALMRELFLAAAGGRWRGLLVQLDQSKAFYRVDRAYLWAVLCARGVPEGYICLLQRLYKRATAVPTVEGWRGKPVPLASGLRQGCPLSPLLYVLALDLLLEAVRADGHIAGVLARGSGRRLKAVAHADDAYVLLRHGEGELRALRELLAEYGAVSGAAVNTKKSRCYAGAFHSGLLRFLFKGGNPTLLKNWRPLTITNVDYRLLAWWSRGRRPGLFQRVRLFNMFCVPAALGLAAVYPPPRDIIATVEGHFFRFVWGARRFPLVRATAYRLVREGGLGAAALGPLFIATFLAWNFGAWARWRAAAGEDGARATQTPVPEEFAWDSFKATW
ncbi:hypothetical protein lerEdw1_016466 [Lerista edwardsae]|nr:hypothetical protein lerEdw1_016466 [Lerista edwardsae]